MSKYYFNADPCNTYKSKYMLLKLQCFNKTSYFVFKGKLKHSQISFYYEIKEHCLFFLLTVHVIGTVLESLQMLVE